MWFLIKGTFWFAAVLVVLSYFGAKPAAQNDGASALEVASAFSAATEAYQYVSAICSEKPEVCEKGAETFSALGVRAKDGARVAFELLDRQFGAKEAETAVRADPNPTPFPAPFPARQAETAGTAASDTIFTGTVPVPQKRPAH
ncbi:DUF5330 domain-containing protein [Rhizobium terrae]|uniref:DUF5330 domain-containing protein n=1 Tax=Rhizobium terrae TaxID=2171756 RepID=UPI000E3D203A|nr:DUF5330 domain-containing protein [Rhizobium terrae]